MTWLSLQHNLIDLISDFKNALPPTRIRSELDLRLKQFQALPLAADRRIRRLSSSEIEISLTHSGSNWDEGQIISAALWMMSLLIAKSGLGRGCRVSVQRVELRWVKHSSNRLMSNWSLPPEKRELAIAKLFREDASLLSEGLRFFDDSGRVVLDVTCDLELKREPSLTHSS
jgi:hypothetical protein